MNKQQLAYVITKYLRDNGFNMGFMVNGELKPVPLLQGEELLRHMLVTIQQVLAVGGKIRIPELGTFEVKTRKPRMGRNPKTGEKVKIKATTRVAFKNSKQLRAIVNTK